jgi:PAS domain S-box-containing protein
VTAAGRHLGLWGTLAILASVAILDLVLLGLRDDELLVTAWWSSVGLSTALLACSPLRRWPALVAALSLLAVAVVPVVGLDFGSEAVDMLSHVGEAVVAAGILTRGGRRPAALTSLTDLYLLGCAAVVTGAVAAVVDDVPRPDWAIGGAEVLLQVGMQHALSVVLFGALLIGGGARSRTGRTGPPRIPLAVGVQSTALLAALAVVFVPESPLPLTFLPLPFLVWGAILLDVRFAAGQLLLLGASATITTPDDPGPFNSADVSAYLVGPLTLGYVASAALVTLPMAVIVTQRRELLRRAAADEHLFHRTFTESALGMVLLHAEGDHLAIHRVNAAAGRILGAPVEALEGRDVADLLATVDHRDHVFDALLAEKIDTWQGQVTVVGRAGSVVDLSVGAIAEGGSTPVFSAQLLDRTEEHANRRGLDLAHTLTTATLDTAASIIVVIDETGTVTRVNGAATRLTGHAEQSLTGRPLWETPLAFLTRAETEAMFLWPNRSGVPMTRERTSSTVDGDPIRLTWSTAVVRGTPGSPAYAVLTGVDVTTERSNASLMAHLLQASTATALIGLDVSGHITLFNAGAARMLASEASVMIGTPFVSVLDPQELAARTGAVGEREAFLCLVGMIGDDGESPTLDWTWRTAHGHELIVSMTLSVTDAAVEDRVGFLCVARDVTEQREGRDTLVAALEKERTAVERLRALDGAKDEFVSTVSHELRTPVTSIIGYTELLLDGAGATPVAQQVAMLETIARSSHRLVAICDDLLLLSSFDAPDAPAHREVYDLRETLGAAEELARAARAERRLGLTFSTPDDPVLVSGDRSQLDRLLVNLVGNAIKFTDDAGRVDVRLTRDEERGAVVTVSDTGIGIAAEDHDLVFQRFYRTDQAQTMAVPGTGLGLSIVAGIVDAHGGAIALESARGAGTTVTVRLPTA